MPEANIRKILEDIDFKPGPDADADEMGVESVWVRKVKKTVEQKVGWLDIPSGPGGTVVVMVTVSTACERPLNTPSSIAVITGVMLQPEDSNEQHRELLEYALGRTFDAAVNDLKMEK